jgi:ketosteroid isomerase-like protein
MMWQSGAGSENVMSDRSEIERVLKDAYAARKRGDIDAILRVFSPDVHFQLAGSTAASPIPLQIAGAAQFRSVLEGLIRTFEWVDQRILCMLIDGQRAAVHWRGKIRSTATGETVDTELVDIVELKDGRIVSFVEFCDTALATRLMTSGPRSSVAV